MSLRSTANFTVGVSLVNIPMKMYKATDGQKQSDLHQLCPTDKVRIQQKNLFQQHKHPERMLRHGLHPDRAFCVVPGDVARVPVQLRFYDGFHAVTAFCAARSERRKIQETQAYRQSVATQLRPITSIAALYSPFL